MAWTKPNGYPKSRIDWAGIQMVSDNYPHNIPSEAINIFENWRSCHGYPMHIFKKRLKWVCDKKLKVNALTAQRLKRTPSIIKKLKRSYNGKRPTMNLSQMQDIAGCRVVLANVELANKLTEEYYIKGDLKHNLIRIKDYIKEPKEDGYRSIHLMYSYLSDKKKAKKNVFNGLLVEVQIRSKIQHLWATAIETVDFFTNQAIKSNQGKEDWMQFFKLVSSAFAILESCPLVPNTEQDEKKLFLKIKKIERELKVIETLRGWTSAIDVIMDESTKKMKKNIEFFLLELDIGKNKLEITSYSRRQEQKAIEAYSRLEKLNSDKKYYDVVLVGINDARDLKKTYPNYFADTKEFIELLNKIINKYN